MLKLERKEKLFLVDTVYMRLVREGLKKGCELLLEGEEMFVKKVKNVILVEMNGKKEWRRFEVVR